MRKKNKFRYLFKKCHDENELHDENGLDENGLFLLRAML